MRISMHVNNYSALRMLIITRHVSAEFCLILLTVLSFARLTLASSPDRLPEVYAPTLTNPLLSDRVSSVEMNSGYVWVGTDRGVSRYDKVKRQWKNFTITDGLANNNVLAIALDDREVWIGTRGGVSRYNIMMDKWRHYMPHDGLADRTVTCIAVDSRFVWFGTPKGLSRYDKETNTWARKQKADGLAGDKVKRIAVDADYLWVATEAGVSRYDKLTDSWSNYDKEGGLVDNDVSAIAASEDAVWFGTENKGISLYHVRNSEFARTYTKRDRLTSDQIRSLVMDGTSLWIGLADGGAQRYILSVNAWRQYTTEDGLPSNHITAIAADGNVVWFGTHEHGVARYDLRREEWTSYGEARALSDDDVKSLLATKSRVWVGTRNGLNKYRVGKSSPDWRTISKADGLADNYITGVAESDDSLWVGTPKGLGVRHGTGKWKFYNTADGLADNFVTCLTWDKSRAQLWVGTRDGISTYHPLTESWNSHPGELENLGWVNDILLTEEFIWIATSDGLIYCDRSTETSPTLKQVGGLRGKWVNAISFSGDSLWAGTRWGLARLKDLSDPQATQLLHRPTKATPGTPSRNLDTRFEMEFPLPVPNFVRLIAHSNVVTIEAAGEEIWLGTPHGLARYDLNADKWTAYTLKSTNGELPVDNITTISITEADVWIGTTGGVNRFDKETRRWTRHVASRTTEVLQANRVAHLQEDGDFIWFGNWNETTEGAIGQYNRVTEKFRFFSRDDLPLQPNAPSITLVHGITTDDESVWFGTNAGVLRYDKLSDTWRHYTLQDGLPNNEIWSVTLDSDHIWTLHIGGVVGRLFIEADHWQHWEISPSAIWSTLGTIAVDSEYVWVSTAWEGIKRFNKSTEMWETFSQRDGLGHSETNDILIDDDYVWITAWGDASRYNRRTEEWEILSDDRVLSSITFGIQAGIDGFWMLYAWTNWGDPIASKYHYSTQSWSELKTPRISRGKNYNEWFGAPRQLVETPENIWLATQGAGIGRYNKASKDWRFLNYETGLANDWLAEDSMVVDDNYVWVGNSGGLSRYDKKTESWTTFIASRTSSAISPRKVSAIAADSRYLWVGTPAGLHRYDKEKNQWTHHQYKRDWAWGVKSLTADEKYLWLGTNGGVRRYDKSADRWEEYTVKNGLPSDIVRDVDVEGYDLWVATDGGTATFNRLSDDPNAWETHSHSLEIETMGDERQYAQTLLSNDVRCVTVAKDFVWFGTDEGVCRYSRANETWETFLTKDDLNVEDISAIVTDGNTIWFGTNRGVTKYDTVSKDTVSFTPTDGLASYLVTCIAVDGTEIWFGSANSGATRYDKATGEWKIFNAKHGLIHNGVKAIAVDGEQIWFGTELGLCRYDRQVGTWTSYAEEFSN